MIATETIVQTRKLKIKFPKCKHVEAVSQCEVEKKVSCGNLRSDPSVDEKSTLSRSSKRGPTGGIDGQKEKRQKLDRAGTVQCTSILKFLMSHDLGWPFKEPVDPVALNIPDYFLIISKPMDLGTIKSKLENNMYFGIEEFTADVRLTFANAMRYNPPGNPVHVMAKDLNKIFENKWKEIEKRVKGRVSKDGHAKSSNREIIESNCTKKDSYQTPSLQKDVLSKRTSLSEEKSICGSAVAKAVKVHVVVSSKASQELVPKNSKKGSDDSDRPGIHSLKADSLKTHVNYKCSMCGGVKCSCYNLSKSENISSDASSERSQGRGLQSFSDNALRPVSQPKSMSPLLVGKCRTDSDGGLSCLDDDFGSHVETSAVEAAPTEGWCNSGVDIQLSPQKALRAAMLKSRFAETILKAQHKTLLNNGDRADPLMLKQEREKLKKMHREEKAKLEAQMKAAEAALLMAEEELKQRREKERQAARIELLNMEKTVEFEQNLENWKELEMLCGFTQSCGYRKGTGLFSQAQLRNPLEELGLFMKDEHLEDDDEKFLNKQEEGEEGEILS